ncbi:MAG TPA: alpha/beta fold hydrolase [Candidatus Angelobacter sp.]
MAKILVLGHDGFVGAELAARLLASSEHQIFMLAGETSFFSREELLSMVHESFHRKSAGRDLATSLEDLTKRFTLLAGDDNGGGDEVEALPQVEEVWLLEGEDSADILAPHTAADRLSNALSMLPRLKAHVFNYVYSMYGRHVAGTAVSDAAILGERIGRQCEPHGAGHRMFQTGALIGENYIRAGSGGNDIRQLLAALDDVTAEIQERLPEYFDFQSLRLLAKPGASVNLMRVEDAVEIMVCLAQQQATLGEHYCVVSVKNTPLKTLGRLLGKLYGASLAVVAAPQQLNAIDRLLEQRFCAVDEVFVCPDPVGNQDLLRKAGVVCEPALLDDKSLQNVLGVIRKKQANDRAERNRRAASPYSSLSPRSTERPGSKLDYFVAGSDGPHVLILNALGQGLEFWGRLTGQLMHEYRVVLWETRGLESESETLQVKDHLEDIECILRQENITSCYVVGWCTGPQLAVEFYLRRPESILGMVFLNSVFKFAGRPELETPYSTNLEKLCRLLDARPEMAPSVMRSLSTPPANDINLMDETDTNNTARQVLSLTNVDLRTHVLAPFRTVTTTLNYARQILDLLACPTLEKTARVEVPILIVGCEYDQVASAAKSREAAGLFPRCRHIELPGATHYSIYDRAGVVAAMLRRFLSCPSSVVETARQFAVAAE